MECTEIQILAAEALYNIERGIRPVSFGGAKNKIETRGRSVGKMSISKMVLLAMVLASSIHFSGILKNSVEGRVVSSHGPFNCDLGFHSFWGVSRCSTDASGRFQVRLYGGVYRVVVERRPGLPGIYLSPSTTPLRLRAETENGIVLRIAN